jgi:methylmalonyl-CoA/ethylmalonyl-CoA epimerase
LIPLLRNLHHAAGAACFAGERHAVRTSVVAGSTHMIPATVFDRIDHVGVVVADLKLALAVYEDTFGFGLVHREVMTELGLEIALVQIGESRIELLVPISDDNVIPGARPGMHHVAYSVNDIDAELERLHSLDVRLIDTVARKGAHDSRVAFIHPHATGGVLTELVEAART